MDARKRLKFWNHFGFRFSSYAFKKCVVMNGPKNLQLIYWPEKHQYDLHEVVDQFHSITRSVQYDIKVKEIFTFLNNPAL